MTEGVIIDNTYGSRMVSSWLEGAPSKSMWVGVRLQGKTPIETQTFRCNKCGFLESYSVSDAQ
jgi:hypothetical protein